jgi:predicted membrane protein
MFSPSGLSSSIGGRLSRTALRRIEFAIILLYSLAVMASAVPFFANISNLPVILYYLFVPGYCVTKLFGEDYPIVQRALFSSLISITLVLFFFSLRQTVLLGIHLPYDLLVPVLALIILLFTYYHPRR